jgi:hypothetical protein
MPESSVRAHASSLSHSNTCVDRHMFINGAVLCPYRVADGRVKLTLWYEAAIRNIVRVGAKFAVVEAVISLLFGIGFLHLFIPLKSHLRTLFSCGNRLDAVGGATVVLASRCRTGRDHWACQLLLSAGNLVGYWIFSVTVGQLLAASVRKYGRNTELSVLYSLCITPGHPLVWINLANVIHRCYDGSVICIEIGIQFFVCISGAWCNFLVRAARLFALSDESETEVVQFL